MKNKFVLIALSVLVIDHVTKWIVMSEMTLHQSVEIIPGFLRLSFVRNTGVAFGLFDDVQSGWKQYVLAVMAIVAVIFIVIYSLRMPANRVLLRWALSIIMGGIIGNFIDRIVRGFVVDFIEFHIRESFYWPTFNAADSAITIGIVLLLIDTIIYPGAQEELQQS